MSSTAVHRRRLLAYGCARSVAIALTGRRGYAEAMALFSRRPKPETRSRETKPSATNGDEAQDASGDAAAASPAETSPATGSPAEATAPEAPAESVPHVGISVSAFRGAISEPDETRGPEASVAPVSTAPRNAPTGAAFGRAAAAAAPAAPAGHATNGEPPAQTETLPGLKDNTLLAQALARVQEQPTSKQLIDVARQLLQGFVFLRVQGDAAALAAAGQPLPLQVATIEDQQFVFAFSSGAALQASLQEDEVEGTSAMGQPGLLVIARAIDSGFGGVILDPASHPHRAVLPIAVLQQALAEITDAGAPEGQVTRIKELLCAPRTAETPAQVAHALVGQRLWIAAGEAPGSTPENPQLGVAEARTGDGQRFIELFSHPLEVVAMDRGDRPVPFEPAQLGEALRSDPGITGVIVDPAGPWLRLTRNDLGDVLALPAPGGATPTGK